MKTRCLLLALGLCLAAATVAEAFDTIKTISGATRCKVTSVNWKEIGYDEINGVPDSVPVNEVVTVYFDDEPKNMRTARDHLIERMYDLALISLNKVDATEIDNKWVTQDLEFYKALCAAKLALGGSGSVADAGRTMAGFAKKHTTSYHYLESCEVVGDLLAALGKFSSAEAYYGRVAQAPWPDFKMRAYVAMATALLAQNTPAKTAQAEKLLDSVLAMDVEGDLAKMQKMRATLLKARCQVGTNAPAAIAAVKKIIADADPEDVDLHALAYNTLGTGLRKAGKDGEALLAFLHVHVLYFNSQDAHAEALYHLAALWTKLGKSERARNASGLLKNRYPNSRWASLGGS